MKVKKQFAPVTITIETEEELQYLWHALNASSQEIEDLADCFGMPFPKNAERLNLKMFNELNDEITTK